MFEGTVVSIYICKEPGQRMQLVHEANAVPGKGLIGDRYYNQHRDVSDKRGTGRELTLIEQEAIEAVKHEKGIDLTKGKTRRNIITQGVPLNHLVGKKFQVGEVDVLGMRLCEPCNHLGEMTEKEVLPALIHRGGLRAEIISEGIIRIGDKVIEA